MPTFSSLLTSLGLAKIATAMAHSSTVSITEIAVGDGNGNPTIPNVGQTSLVREVYRATLNSLSVDPHNPNYFIAELIVPPDVGGWTVREVGVFDDSGAMIAIANFPDTYKPLIVDGSSQQLVIRVYFAVDNPAVISLMIDPSLVVATRLWVTSNFSIAALLPGGTTGEILRKHSNADGDTEWFDPVAGFNITVNTAEENQVASAGQTVVNPAIVTTSNMSVFINGLRLRANQFTITDSTHFTVGSALSAGDKITMVQNEPAGATQYLQTQNNLSEIAAAGTAAKAAAVANLGLLGSSAMIAAVLQALYPIGEVLTTRRPGNPNSWLGFGTWEAYAPGRVIVGLNGADIDFNAVDKEGGEKTHQLINAELSGHVHRATPPVFTSSFGGSHSHAINPPTGSTDTAPDHVHTVSAGGSGITADGNVPNGGGGIADRNSQNTSASGSHSHAVTIPSFNSAAVPSHQHLIAVPAFDTLPTGGDQPHNNLQPFKVLAIWLRTA